ELAQVRKEGMVEEYVVEFERLSIMIMNVTEKRLIVLFIKDLNEPLKGLVRAFDPLSFQEVIKKSLDLEGVATKTTVISGHSK
ncbi:hypothetical protein KI387_019891, partial [Taxus chinensis]